MHSHRYIGSEGEPEIVSLSRLRAGVYSVYGGNVYVSGKGVASHTRLDVRVAEFLARLPGEEADSEAISKLADHGRDWINHYLIPAGLVGRIDNNFIRTTAANNATYEHRPIVKLDEAA